MDESSSRNRCLGTGATRVFNWEQVPHEFLTTQQVGTGGEQVPHEFLTTQQVGTGATRVFNYSTSRDIVTWNRCQVREQVPHEFLTTQQVGTGATRVFNYSTSRDIVTWNRCHTSF